MSKIDKTYHDLLLDILQHGYKYEDPNRKGINRIQIPHYTIVHDFKDGFPVITTKKLHWKSIVGELLWILRGDTNIKYLVNNNINIWNKDAYNYYCKRYNTTPYNAKEDGFFTLNEFISTIKNKSKEHPVLGDIGRNYGAQLRQWLGSSFYFSMGDSPHRMNYIDQLADLIHTLKTNPMATKKTVTFWNPAEKDKCSLTPCHWSFEILVEPLSWNERLKLIDQAFGNLSKSIDMKDFNEAQKSKNRLEELNKIADGINIPKYQFTLKWHQHSVDTFLGLPFNIASYALLAQIIGKITNMVPKGIIGDLSNVHIYEPHLDAVKEQLRNDIDKYSKCELLMEDVIHYITDEKLIGKKNIDEIINSFKISNFILNNYNSYPSIKAEMLPYS